MKLFDGVAAGEDMVNEPAWHPAVKNSFLYVPTAGIRVAPEILVLELFREIFFKEFSESAKERQLGESLREKYASTTQTKDDPRLTGAVAAIRLYQRHCG